MARPIEKRDIIVRTALELFVEKGIEATTIRNIAQRAGAAEGTMYRHFESKDQLAWTLFHENTERLTADLLAAIACQDTARDKIGAMIVTFYRFCEDDPTLYTYLLLSESTHLRRFPDTWLTPAKLLVTIIDDGKRRGEIDDIDTQLATAIVFGAVQRPALFRIHGRLDHNLTDVAATVADACWRAIGGIQDQEGER